MTVDEFEQLRDLPGKVVTGDLEFLKTSNPDVFRCEMVLGSFQGHEVRLTASYYDHIPAVTFNFRVTGFKAVCRYCVNNTAHIDHVTGKKVRTHKHSPESDYCFRNNLPRARERTDLDITDFADVQNIWDVICKDANILHSGKVIKY